MMVLSILITALIVSAIGRLLVKRLGWPTTLAGAGRWGLALLGLSVFFSCLPELLERLRDAIGPLPTVRVQDLVPGLCVVALGMLGYVAWTRDAVARELAADDAERAGRLPRRRALPPAPQGLPAHHHERETFRPLDGADEFHADEDPQE